MNWLLPTQLLSALASHVRLENKCSFLAFISSDIYCATTATSTYTHHTSSSQYIFVKRLIQEFFNFGG